METKLKAAFITKLIKQKVKVNPFYPFGSLYTRIFFLGNITVVQTIFLHTLTQFQVFFYFKKFNVSKADIRK